MVSDPPPPGHAELLSKTRHAVQLLWLFSHLFRKGTFVLSLLMTEDHPCPDSKKEEHWNQPQAPPFNFFLNQTKMSWRSLLTSQYLT